MAETTRVPLQPIAKGSMMKFWLGVLVGAALAGAVAWFTSRPPSIDIETIAEGEGASPVEGDVVFVDYTAKLEDGTVVDQSPPPQEVPEAVAHLVPKGAFLEVDSMIPGFRDALKQMQRGGKYTVEIPSELAYGSTPPPGSPIPADANMIFDVTLNDFMTQEELQERSVQIQQIMMQQMQENGGQLPGAEGQGAPAQGAAPAPPAPAPAQ